MEPTIELSHEQKRAIYTPGPLAVRAGAGSGKTEVLARRFVALLAGDIAGRAPLLPEQIAAITFTEKATQDMKRRIAEVLGERIAAEADAERLSHLTRARRALGLARISTIHAFCARVLRENPLEAELDPDFEVLDEYETETFLERNVEDLLLAALRKGDPGALRLLTTRGLRSAWRREGAIDLVLRLLVQMQRFGRDPQWLLRATAASCKDVLREQPEVNRCARRLLGLLDQLRRSAALPLAARDRMDKLNRDWPRYAAALETFDASSPPETLDVLAELGELLPAASGRIKEKIAEIKRLLKSDPGKFGCGGELIDRYGAVRAVEPARDLARLLGAIATELDQRKRRQNIVGFDDLLIRTHRLLTDHPEVARRLKLSLRALLVDEFQDTDPIQGRIVALLAGAAEAGAEPAELFIVGDEKQSIYRFRGADVTVFKEAIERIPAEPLRDSRRAVPDLIAFVNGLCERVMRPPATALPDPDDEPEAAGSEAPAQELAAAIPPYWVQWDENHELRPVRPALCGRPPAVEFLVTAAGGGHEPVGEGRRREALALALRICELVARRTPVMGRDGRERAARFGDIAILMRSFQDVAIYEAAMREQGLPCYTVKGRGFFGCAEVLDLADLLAAVDDPGDSMALAAALRSPLFALSDQCLLEIALHQAGGSSPIARLFRTERPDFDWLKDGRDEALWAFGVLRELRSMRERASVVDIVQRALDLTDFEAVMIAQSDGKQRVANIRKLVEIARDLESRGCFTFADFVRHLRRLTATEPLEPMAQIVGEEEDVVRLMTIHQAKGLEFPIVIVADLGRSLPPPPSSYVLSPKRGLLARATAGAGHDELPNPQIREENRNLRREDEAERARLLYVAITRARDRLILSEGAVGAAGWSRQIREFLSKDRVARFILSGAKRTELELEGAIVELRRASTEAAAGRAATAGADAAAAARDAAFERLAQERLRFSPAPAAELLASPTALADFDRCPRLYQYRHLLGIPERDPFSGPPPETRADVDAADAEAREKGIVAHAVLEALDLRLRGTELTRGIAEILERYRGEFNLAEADRTKLIRDLSRYLESCTAAENVVGRELPFFLNLGDAAAAGQPLELFIRGQIDLLAEESAALLVRDYKYSRFEPEQLPHYRTQMECYAIAAASAYPERAVRAELVFLRQGPETRKIELPTPDQIRARLVEIGRAMMAARLNGHYPIKPPGPWRCRKLGCGYVPRCWGKA